MLFPNKIKSLTLSVLLLASIPHLRADTNLPDTKSEQVTQAPLSTLQITKLMAENFDMVISMVFDTQSKQGQPLVDALTPLLTTIAPIKDLPDNATDIEVYQAMEVLKQAAIYLNDLIQKEASKMDEFNPVIPAVTQVSADEMQKADAALQNAFGMLFKKLEESYQDSWATMLMHVRNQLNQLDSILQTIFKNIATKSNLVNKDDVKAEIKDLRNTLTQIRKELASAQPSPQLVLSILQVNQVIIRYLQDAQKTKFRQWKMVDLAGELLRNQDADQPQMLDDIFANIAMTNGALKQLEKDAEKIDLTFTNKAARFIGDTIIDPVLKYDLITWTIGGAATIGLATYILYYFDNTFFTDQDSNFRKLFGFPNHLAGKTLSATPEYFAAAFKNDPEKFKDFLNAVEKQDRKAFITYLEGMLNEQKKSVQSGMLPIAKFDDFISAHKTGTAATGVFLFGAATYAYQQIIKRNGYEWSKKIYVWFEKLKGGSYAKNAEKYDEILGSSITFDDIIGMEYEKQLVYPHLKYIKDPERWDANEQTPPTGILLTGPTRTGKTFFAKAICGELHKQNPDKTIRFFSITAHDIKAEGIDSIMRLAKLFAPCVLFIDEIDLLGLQRDKDKTLLADFLAAMSGIADKDPKKQVIVIGTTNKPENMDEALRQSGRLALEIRFKYPTLKERIDYITKRLEKFAIDPEIFEIDINKLARETHGKSFEDIKLMLDMAFIHIGIKGSVISQNILEWSLDAQLRRIVDIDSKEVAQDEQELLSAHYAGQVLCHLLLNLDEKIAKVTTRQVVTKVKEEIGLEQFYKDDHKKQTGLDHGAIFTYFEHDSLDIKNQSTQEISKKAKTLLAGRIAERLLTHNASGFFGWKKNTAYNMIKAIAADGIDLKSLSKTELNKVGDDAHAMLKKFEQEIEQLLTDNMESLKSLANSLQKEHTLSIKQIMDIVAKPEAPVAIPAAA
jgi:ATP-dependent Zn protease